MLHYNYVGIDQVNSTLTELKLSLHSMTDTGCEWLCSHLLENTSLTHLDVSRSATLLSGILIGILIARDEANQEDRFHKSKLERVTSGFGCPRHVQESYRKTFEPL